MEDTTVQTGTQAAGADSATATQTPSVDQTAQTATQDGTVTSTGQQASTTQETPKEPGAEPTGAEKRIAQLIARQKEADRQAAAKAEEAAYWKGVAEGRTKPGEQTQTQQATVETTPVEPDPDDYDQYGDKAYDIYQKALRAYDRALAKYELRQEIKQEQEQARRQTEATKAAEAAAKIRETFESRMKNAAEEDEDITTIREDQSLLVSPAMASVIMQSEIPEKLLRHLHEHRDEDAKIAAMIPIAAAREMVRIEMTLTKPIQQTNTVSQAPVPHQTVNANKGTPVVDDDKLPIGEFIRRRNERQFGKAKEATR
jgi:hypothetical protein